MSQYAFGSGLLVGTAITDAYGAALASPTPILLGVMQDGGVEFSRDIKELFGQYQHPVAIGAGKAKITGKSKYAQLNGLTVNSLYFGQTLSYGTLANVFDNTGVAIPATPGPYTITPTAPGSGTWAKDLGVLDANGVPMVRVVSGPATGQYSVSAGVYTFAAADQGKIVRISYQYTATSAVATKIALKNTLMGQQPTFQVDFTMPFEGKQAVISLPRCVSSKLGFATKLDDFMITEFDYSAFADSANNIAYVSFSE